MPNSRQVSPDVTDEEREAPRPTNSNNMEQDVAGHGQHGPGVAGVIRRDENSISFRHFLQPHSDVVPSPAPTCRSRSTRGMQPGAVDLVDGVMGLPDFVQDHLVVESLAVADHQNNGGPSHSGGASVDLNVLNEILPDFAAQQAHSLPAHPMQSRRRNIPEEPVVAPDAHGAAGGTSALPDFLSDGPMQCTDSTVVDPSISSSRSASRLIPSNSLAERGRVVDEASRSSSFDSSETMRSEVERLRRDVSERNIRISQLEGEIQRLRTVVSSLESSLRSAEQNSVTIVGAGDSAVASSSTRLKVNGRPTECLEIDAQSVREIAQSSETLLSQLLQNMALLKEFSNSTSDGDKKTILMQKSSKDKPN